MLRLPNAQGRHLGSGNGIMRVAAAAMSFTKEPEMRKAQSSLLRAKR